MNNPYSSLSKEELERLLLEYDSAICFDTTCLTCSKLYDKLYAREAAMNEIYDILASVPVPERTKVLGQIFSIVETYKWGKA